MPIVHDFTGKQTEFDFIYCSTCRGYQTFRWVKSLQMFECEQCGDEQLE